MDIENRWITADGELSQLPIRICYREAWQQLSEQNLDVCVQIAWHAKEKDSQTQFPALAEMVLIDVFNQQLMVLLEEDKTAYVSMVITHNGINQWVIYGQDLEKIKTVLDSMNKPEKGYPIEVVADNDADWHIFRQVKQAIKQN